MWGLCNIPQGRTEHMQLAGDCSDYSAGEMKRDCSVVCRQHYPGASSPDAALRLDKTLWASEEYSAYNDLHGGGCWARVSS